MTERDILRRQHTDTLVIGTQSYEGVPRNIWNLCANVENTSSDGHGRRVCVKCNLDPRVADMAARCIIERVLPDDTVPIDDLMRVIVVLNTLGHEDSKRLEQQIKQRQDE